MNITELVGPGGCILRRGIGRGSLEAYFTPVASVLNGQAERPIPQMYLLLHSGVLDGEEILGRGGWKLEQVDHVTRVELEAESGLTLRVAAEIADFAADAGDAVLGLAGEDAVLEELSGEGKPADSAYEFGNDVSFDLEALRGDLRRHLKGRAEGLTDAFAFVVHDSSFLKGGCRHSPVTSVSFRSLSSL
jgi:hypothetical protein